MPWLLVIFVVSTIVAAVVVVRARTGTRRPDVGAVSDQWVAAHRSDQQDY